MDVTDYSLMRASMEIGVLVLGAFVLGMLTCKILKAIGLCCRNQLDDESSLFALKEPSFDTSPTPVVRGLPPERFVSTLPDAELERTSQTSLSHNYPPLPPVPDAHMTLPPVSLKAPLPAANITPTPIKTMPEPILPAVIREHNTDSPSNASTSPSEGYVVDINTLLRRNPETHTPVATLAAAAKHRGYDTQNGRFTNSVSIADLLNTQTDLIDNLRKIEGISPRIEALLNEAGIKNYNTLSKADPLLLRDILLKAGDQYRNLDPQTWPFQAELAAKGEWARLQDYQNYLLSNQ